MNKVVNVGTAFEKINMDFKEELKKLIDNTNPVCGYILITISPKDVTEYSYDGFDLQLLGALEIIKENILSLRRKEKREDN